METGWEEAATAVLILRVKLKSFLTITSALGDEDATDAVVLVMFVSNIGIFTWGELILVSSDTGIGIKEIQQL